MTVGARSAVFGPLDQTGRTEAVTRRLTDAITLGLLADQEQLPSESELAGNFGVSTVTVREALAALRQQGLVETRRGRGGGSFVRTPAGPTHGPLRERLREMTLAELRDAGDHYTAIAGSAAKLAAERASQEDLQRIRSAAGERDAPAAGAYRTERAFHLEVAAAAQSPRLTQQEVRLQGEVGTMLWLPASEESHLTELADTHADIATAIDDADGDRAQSLTESHIARAIHRLSEMHLQLISP